MRKAPIHWTAASSVKCKAGSLPENRVFMQSIVNVNLQHSIPVNSNDIF